MEYIIYLAAGNSKRFGSNKLLYEYKGRRLFEYGLDAITEACGISRECPAGMKERTVLVVTQYQEIEKYAERLGIRTVMSPESRDGMSFTIKKGLEALKISAEDLIMFVVADQPHLTAATINRLFEAAQGAESFETASAYCSGHPGNPTCFSGRLTGELMALKADEGGRKVIRGHECIFVQVDENELADIDTRMSVQK